MFKYIIILNKYCFYKIYVYVKIVIQMCKYIFLQLEATLQVALEYLCAGAVEAPGFVSYLIPTTLTKSWKRGR